MGGRGGIHQGGMKQVREEEETGGGRVAEAQAVAPRGELSPPGVTPKHAAGPMRGGWAATSLRVIRVCLESGGAEGWLATGWGALVGPV